MSLVSLCVVCRGYCSSSFGGDRLVQGASSLARSFGISSLVIGLTVVAFGTSAPELAVSVNGALHHSGDVAVGNVVGSNIFNVLAILGLSALITPLAVQSSLIRLEIPLLVVVSLALPLFAMDGVLGRLDGALFFIAAVIYTVWVVVQSRKQASTVREEDVTPEPWWKSALNLIVGLGLLVLGARWVVDGAVEIARFLGLSELVISLTIIAAGTSLPEVVTSISAALKGERDIAVGNVVGSNLFNILCVLGLSAVVTPDGIQVAAEATRFDIPVMIAVAFICVPIFLSGYVVDRLEGAVLLTLYVGYTATVVVMAAHPNASELAQRVYLWGMWPLGLVVTLAILWRARSRRLTLE
ncbi:MAG: calcium/sodium antiporter [bacterium]